ncbi:hypothetical protein BCR34DRAFT_651644 [Clohesyomyces aquaticus]|uniref:RING-type domain-containing protein n=1 Tax=Clohesyomyces aquaticus TaxID=1231657 RepID=A0A1Y1ZPA5_9PLEO|nr:hypothetical protein BCR34DRAFT_651644 [Clohesyomyces aquaticus]
MPPIHSITSARLLTQHHPHTPTLSNPTTTPSSPPPTSSSSLSKMASSNNTLCSMQNFITRKIKPINPFDLEDDNEKCHMCLEEYIPSTCEPTGYLSELPFCPTLEGEEPVRLQCGHVFGSHCIKAWFNEPKKNTCPMCRTPQFYELRMRNDRPVFMPSQRWDLQALQHKLETLSFRTLYKTRFEDLGKRTTSLTYNQESQKQMLRLLLSAALSVSRHYQVFPVPEADATIREGYTSTWNGYLVEYLNRAAKSGTSEVAIQSFCSFLINWDVDEIFSEISGVVHNLAYKKTSTLKTVKGLYDRIDSELEGMNWVAEMAVKAFLVYRMKKKLFNEQTLILWGQENGCKTLSGGAMITIEDIVL